MKNKYTLHEVRHQEEGHLITTFDNIGKYLPDYLLNKPTEVITFCSPEKDLFRHNIWLDSKLDAVVIEPLPKAAFPFLRMANEEKVLSDYILLLKRLAALQDVKSVLIANDYWDEDFRQRAMEMYNVNGIVRLKDCQKRQNKPTNHQYDKYRLKRVITLKNLKKQSRA